MSADRLTLEAVRRVADHVYHPANLTEVSIAVTRVRLIEELQRAGITRDEIDQALVLLKAELKTRVGITALVPEVRP